MEAEKSLTADAKVGDDFIKSRTEECGTMEVLGEKEQKKLVRKIDLQYVCYGRDEIKDSND